MTPAPAPAPAPVTVTAGCTACGACLPTCPERAFRVVGGARPPLRVLPEFCTGCLECLEVCPADAITPVDVEEAP